MASPTYLSQLSPGAAAIIHSIPYGMDAFTRLREMGLVPGTRISVIRRAPLGEPIEISVRGSRLAMRNKEASSIAITPLPNE
jgi:ferrous iron transport protein A